MQISCYVCGNPFTFERNEGVRGPTPKICSEECRKQVKRDKYQVLLKASREAAERRAVQMPHAPLQVVPDAPLDPRRHRVEALAGMGLDAADIAVVERMPVEQLRAEFREELARGPVVANVAVAQNLYRLAQGTGTSAVTAAWKWLQARAGWTEYAPAPNPANNGEQAQPEPLGKKALQNAVAQVAEQGTTWASLIN